MAASMWIEQANGFDYVGVEASGFVTRGGAQCAPVVFHKRRGGFSPYFVSPWQGEGLSIEDPVLQNLRGNFFCLPFGAGGLDENGKVFKAHGEVASGNWEFVNAEKGSLGDSLSLKIQPQDIGGTVTKQIIIGEGHVYTKCVVSGVEGHYPVGYHPNLRMPLKGKMYLSLSPHETARTAGRSSYRYEGGEYYALEPDTDIDDLTRVPMIGKGFTDCLAYPRLEGFVDVVAAYRSQAPGVAWSVAAYPGEGFLYFSLKNAQIFGAALLWMEDRGRHQSPWNGRTRVVGVEDVCGYFAAPVAVTQAPNLMSAKGYRTIWDFTRESSYAFPYIEGVIPISASFAKVAETRFSPGTVEFISVSGESATASVELGFLDA
jgi:hypothetical protein